MTREKAIKIVKEFINGTCLHLVDQEAFETLIPELNESENERIRKWIVAELQNSLNEIYAMYSGDYDNRDAEDKQRQRCLESAISWLEKQKEQPKEELVYRLNGLMQDYIKEGKDEEEKKHRFKCYKLFWDALEDGKFFEQKEQKPADNISKEEYVKRFKALCDAYEFKLPNREYDIYHLCDDLSKLSIDSGKQKSAEWSYPYGKNETTDRLVSLAECLEMDGDCLFNGYSGTECGKFLRELARKQIGCKPSEWSEEDEKMLDIILTDINYAQKHFSDSKLTSYGTKINWLKSLPERFNLQPQQEWSEDNIKELTKFEVAMLHIGMSFFGGSAGLNPNNTNEVKKQAKLLLELVPKQEWSEDDEALFELLHQCVCRCINDDRMDYSERDKISKTMIPFIEKLQTLHPQQEWSEDIIRKAVKEVGLTQHQINWFKNNVFPPKQEWSEEDEDMRKKAIEYITLYSDEYGDYNEIKKVLDWFKFLPERLNLQPQQEWSDEDEKTFWGLTAYIPNEELERLGVTRDDILKKLKSLRPQSIQLKEAYKECFQTARHAIALAFMNYLDENRPEGKMGLSNGECEDIDKAFKEGDWAKIMRYYEKYRPHWKPSEEQKYDGNMDKECIKLCDILNSVPSIDTFESCCGHLKDRYSIWFFCNDIITISRLGRCVERNYSDGKWELLVDSTDTHPTGVFWLRSKVPFQSYDEMEKSVNELCNNIQYWFNTKFDSNFNGDIVKQELHWKPSEEQMSALKSTMYDYKDVDWYNHLSSLYNDLKKL